MIEIDLRAAIIPPQTRVWRLFPGSSYKFLRTFDEQRVAFLDLPGLELPEGELAQADDLLSRVLASQKIAELKRRYGHDHAPDVQPGQFRGARKTTTRGRYRQAVVNFFEVASRGDLVIVPSTLSEGRIRIGQFIQPPNRRVVAFYEPRYGDAPIPARPIRWLRTIPEHQVSGNLRSSLRHEHPFTLLERSLFVETLSFAFECFKFGEQCSSVIYNENNDYTDRETALIGLISNLSASLCEYVENNGDDAIDTDVLEIFLSNPGMEYSCSFSSDIHSMGFSRFVGAKPTALAIVACMAALSALSQCATAQEVQSNLAGIAIINSYAPDDDACTAIVSEATQRFLNIFDIDQLWEVCKSMRESQERAGLRPGVTVGIADGL